MAADASKEDKHGKKYMLVQAFLCVLCVLVGAFYPTLLDWSKTTIERKVELAGKGLVTTERRAYPFSPVSVVFVNDVLQLSIAICFVARKTGITSLWSDFGLFVKMMPLGAIYAIGELLTLRSVEKGSGPVYVVIANMKLVVAAVMSRLFFGQRWSMPCLHWFELCLISLAAALYTLLEAGALGTEWHWEGAWAALTKSSLVAFTSVFCEHTYKSNPFHLTLTLQAFWGVVTMVVLIGLSISGHGFDSVDAELRDEFGVRSLLGAGSKHPTCGSAAAEECLRVLAKTRIAEEVLLPSCSCVMARGWDMYTLLAVFADLSNAISSALVFRRLSAVAKYVCRATSAVPMYVFYCIVGRSHFRWNSFAVVIFLCGQVSVYTVQRHRAGVTQSKAEEAEAAAASTSWAQEYAAPGGGELRRRGP